MQIRISPSLTPEHQAVTVKYLRTPRALSKAEWITALAAFDILSSCRVVVEGKTVTFAKFYEQAFDRPYASVLINELLTIDDVEVEGARRAETIGKRIMADLSLSESAAAQPLEHRMLEAYCLYWWGSLYFLHTTRHFPLKHDFYIATLFDSRMKHRHRVVIMGRPAWDKIDGDTVAAELEQAAALLPRPVAIVVKKQDLIVVEYNLWKEKIRALQNRGEDNE